MYFLDLPILPSDISPLWWVISPLHSQEVMVKSIFRGDAGFEELIRFLQQTRELKAKALALGEAPVGLGRLAWR